MIKNTLIYCSGKDAVTDSTIIAETFEKEHKHVMKSIRKILHSAQEIGQNLTCFQLSTYTDSKNRMQPMYNISYTGFLLLVMGFTGNKALQLKLQYIKENNLTADTNNLSPGKKVL